MSEQEQEPKVMALEDIFSDTDLSAAETIFNRHIDKPYKEGLANVLCREVIEPSIELINYRTGGENEPMYLAQALVSVFEQMTGADASEIPESDPEDFILSLVGLIKGVIEEHDFWHAKNCHVKLELRNKINACREFLKEHHL